MAGITIHLVDGTYELFRYFMSPAAAFDRTTPEELRAVRGVVTSILGMLEGGATHVGVATDHVIESFRNALWPWYKTSAGVEADLIAQFPLLEEALAAMGIAVWPMVEFEADDALAAAAAAAARDPRVDRIVICTPDKDLAQCVADRRVVQFDRRARVMRDGWEVGSLGPGEFFGEVALLEGGPRTATVVAAEKTTCLGILRTFFRPMLVRNPRLALRILEEERRRLTVLRPRDL